jgi:hypothetical protein
MEFIFAERTENEIIWKFCDFLESPNGEEIDLRKQTRHNFLKKP